MENKEPVEQVFKGSSKRLKCFTIFAIGLAFVIFVLYISRPLQSNIMVLTQNASNIDEDKLKYLQSVLQKLQRERGVFKRSLWRRLSGSLHWGKGEREKLVLVYTGFFGSSPWGWLNDPESLNSWGDLKCPYRCKITYDKSLLKKSDAVLFHAQDLSPGSEINALQLSRPRSQRWIFFPTESPANVPENHIVNNIFNWTMSYRPSSDIYRPYGYYYPVTKPYETKDDLIEFIERKDRLSVWAASHCGLLRDKYIHRLKMFMNIDVFGKCGERVGGRSGLCVQDSPDCKKHMQKYKFLFAFENTFCTDYITEKYWFSLMLGVVPVVLGGASYDSSVAIPGSYINAMDFGSIKELAAYLKRLDNNDKEYIKFFEWKKKYKVTGKAPWACQLCALLHFDKKPKIYKHLDAFWGKYKHCGRKEDIIKKVIKNQPLQTRDVSYVPSTR